MTIAAIERVFPHVLPSALCVGIAAANAVRMPSAAVAALAAAVALAAAALRPGARLLALALALALAGWWWGSVRLAALDRSALARHAGDTKRALAVVTGPARTGMFSVRAPAELRRFGREHLRERVLLVLPLGRSPPQGALLDAIVKIELPREDDGEFDERTWLRRRGVHVVAEVHRWRVVGRRGGVGGLADAVRARLRGTLALGVDGERRAVIAGIVLGEDEALSERLRDDFRASGLYHLLAVSGQNIGLLAGGVLLAAWLLGIPRWLGELACLGAIAGYVLAVGWQPSVVRAGVAGALASLAWLAARPRDRWYFLLLGALVLLAWNPYTLLEPGFQLSFAAVSAIFVGVPRLERRLAGYPIPRPLAIVLSVSVACGLATAPILWLHFGDVPVYSAAGNALAAPAVPALLGAALVGPALEPVLPEAAVALSWLNGWLAAYLAACARLVGGLPGAQVSSTAALASGAALVALAALAARLQRRARRRLLAAALVVASLAGVWYAWPDRVAPPPTGLRMTFLDVGQGDSTLIQTRRSAVLVDEGPPEADVAEQLRGLGVRRLDALVMTHPSRDNIGGAEAIVRRLEVGVVVDPALPFANPYGRPALAAARSRGVPVEVARRGDVYRLGGLTLRVLWPDGSALAADDPNDHATVLLASYGEIDALLPADAEANVTAALRPPPVEILKVAHHGSADPLLPRLLERVRPQIAVISVGKDNDYGHPTPSTLAALGAAPDVAVYRTDRDGRIVVDSDGRRLRVWHEP